jgi:hypothetical protein
MSSIRGVYCCLIYALFVSKILRFCFFLNLMDFVRTIYWIFDQFLLSKVKGNFFGGLSICKESDGSAFWRLRSRAGNVWTCFG